MSEELRCRLTRFFEHHNPEKVGDVEQILTKYQGRETELFAALVKKYGPEPTDSSPAGPSPAASPPSSPGRTHSGAPTAKMIADDTMKESNVQVGSTGEKVPDHTSKEEPRKAETDPIEYLRCRGVPLLDAISGLSDKEIHAALRALLRQHT